MGGLERCLPGGRDHVLWVGTGGGAHFIGLNLILSRGFPRRQLELPPLSSALERKGLCVHHPDLGLGSPSPGPLGGAIFCLLELRALPTRCPQWKGQGESWGGGRAFSLCKWNVTLWVGGSSRVPPDPPLHPLTNGHQASAPLKAISRLQAGVEG